MSAAFTEQARLAQTFDALAKANEVRLHRAARRHALAAGEVTLREVLEDPRFATAQTTYVLVAFPSVGIGRAEKALRRAGAWGGRTVGELTERQREVIVDTVSRMLGRAV